jgi:hypothetical protein
MELSRKSWHLIKKSTDSQLAPTVVAARITRKGTLVAAAVTALVALIVGLLANWDKVVAPKHNVQGTGPAATSRIPLPADVNELFRSSGSMPFHTGWVFVGYYDAVRHTYVEGPYASVTFRPTGPERGLLVPELGDVLQIKASSEESVGVWAPAHISFAIS